MPDASRRPFSDALLGLAVATGALYIAWWRAWAPLAPHEVTAALLELDDPDALGRVEAFANVWQVLPFLVLPATAWPARVRATLLAAGFALAAAYQILLGTPYWWLYAYRFVAGAGLVMVVFLVHQRFMAAPEQRAAADYLLVGALIFAAFGVLTKTYLIYSSAVAAPVLDLSALQLDTAAFGFSPSAAALELARDHPGLRRLLAIMYETLPLAMAAVFGLEARAPGRLPFGLLRGLVVCGFVAAAAYAITPVAGPAYVFGNGFIESLQALLDTAPAFLATAPGFSPRNAFPSFHAAWALLAVLLTMRFRPAVRLLFMVYAAFIGVSTLALGEHYLVDLVASFPILLAIAALCIDSVPWRRPERWHALAGGIAMYSGWAVLLQPGVAPLAAQAGLALAAWCAVNVAASIVLYRRLLVATP